MRKRAAYKCSLLRGAKTLSGKLNLLASLKLLKTKGTSSIKMLSLLHSLLFVSTLTLRTVSGEGDALKPVYFSFIVSNGEYGYRSSGAIPSIDIALEAVQELQLLPGYNLTYSSVKNSRVSIIIIEKIICNSILIY